MNSRAGQAPGRREKEKKDNDESRPQRSTEGANNKETD